MLVPPHIKNGNTERPLSSVLRVRLLDVAQPGHQLFAGHRFLVLIQIPLADQSEFVGQDVCVGCDPGHGAGHVLVQVVDLLRVKHLVKEFVDISSFGGQEDSVLGEDAKASAGVTDGFHRVFHLEETALG